MNDIDDYLKGILEPEECEEKIKTKNIAEENMSYSDHKPCTTGFVLSTPKWIEPEKMAKMYEEFRHLKTDEDYIKNIKNVVCL